MLKSAEKRLHTALKAAAQSGARIIKILRAQNLKRSISVASGLDNDSKKNDGTLWKVFDATVGRRERAACEAAAAES